MKNTRLTGSAFIVMACYLLIGTGGDQPANTYKHTRPNKMRLIKYWRVKRITRRYFSNNIGTVPIL